MTIIAELTGEQVYAAVVAYAEAMLPPGWFKFTEIDAKDDGGFVVSFEPVPVSERPKPPPDVAPLPGEAPAVDLNYTAPATIVRDGNMSIGNSGVMVRV